VSILRELAGRPVTVRLLDPPLHEFLPHSGVHCCAQYCGLTCVCVITGSEQTRALAMRNHCSLASVEAKLVELEEHNPMLGHRGWWVLNT
jgi:pyruvate,orthophosphate dikinase